MAYSILKNEDLKANGLYILNNINYKNMVRYRHYSENKVSISITQPNEQHKCDCFTLWRGTSLTEPQSYRCLNLLQVYYDKIILKNIVGMSIKIVT